MNFSEALNITLNNTAMIECIEIQTLASRAVIISVLLMVFGFVMGLLMAKNMYSPRKKKGKGKGLRGGGCKGGLVVTA